MSSTLAWTIVSLSRVRFSIPRRTRLVADAGAASERIAARVKTYGETRRLNGTATSSSRRSTRSGAPQVAPARNDPPRRYTPPLGKHAIDQGLARWATPGDRLGGKPVRACLATRGCEF